MCYKFDILLFVTPFVYAADLSIVVALMVSCSTCCNTIQKSSGLELFHVS
jgi:hypothetical protein